ncbi:MAG: glycerophosphodiester phosphodiesterase family protein [Paracoccaceae bacterium]
MTLPDAFLTRPIAHRALHEPGAGRPENSLSAIRAAVAEGYGIEIDVQASRDGVPMVFHDYVLQRLTAAEGALATRTAAELGAIRLRDGDAGIPTLSQAIEAVAGRVPLLVEVKDQHGTMGPGPGRLERAVAALLSRAAGPVAAMSFNPHAVAAMRDAAPDLPLGLTTCAYEASDWPLLPEHLRVRLRDIPDYDALGCGFVSHDKDDLDGNARLRELKRQGAGILCWTVRSPEQERAARRIADNVTFEGYAA